MTDPVIHNRNDRMKFHENKWRQLVPAKNYTILRVDGRAFHTLTRGMTRPFSITFMQAMDQVGVALCTEVQGAQFAYIQSDEVSVLLTDFGPQQEPWFGGVVQKMTSVSASIASNAFNASIGLKDPEQPWRERVAQFDARVFTVPSREEAINYFLHRQRDCHVNAVSMAAEAVFSSKQLLHMGTGERMLLLESRDRMSFEDAYPQGFRLGRVAIRIPEQVELTYQRKDTGGWHTEPVVRYPWKAEAAPWFDWDAFGFLETNVPEPPELHEDDLAVLANPEMLAAIEESMAHPELRVKRGRPRPLPLDNT